MLVIRRKANGVTVYCFEKVCLLLGLLSPRSLAPGVWRHRTDRDASSVAQYMVLTPQYEGCLFLDTDGQWWRQLYGDNDPKMERHKLAYTEAACLIDKWHKYARSNKLQVTHYWPESERTVYVPSTVRA